MSASDKHSSLLRKLVAEGLRSQSYKNFEINLVNHFLQWSSLPKTVRKFVYGIGYSVLRTNFRSASEKHSSLPQNIENEGFEANPLKSRVNVLVL